MRRLILISATVGALGLGSTAASAAPMHGLAVAAPAPAVTLAGWWEQENHGDAADRYWQLKPADRKRYDAAEGRIQKRHHHHVDQYNKSDAHDVATQHRLLHYDTH